jgi:hypothetical protein
MKLIPKELREQIPTLYATEDDINPTVYVKLFIDGWTWFITELSMDDETAFGYVVSPFCSGELGYFSLNEIVELKGSLGIGVERDLCFKPTSLAEIKQVS